LLLKHTVDFHSQFHQDRSHSLCAIISEHMDVRLTDPFSFFRRVYKHADTHDCVYWTACIVWAISYPFTHMPVTPSQHSAFRRILMKQCTKVI